MAPRLWGEGAVQLYSQEAELVGSRKKMSNELSLQDLEYADDMALISDSMDLLEELMQAMEVSCSEMGLTINPTESKILAVRPADRPSQLPRAVLLRPAVNQSLLCRSLSTWEASSLQTVALIRK